MIIGLRCNEGKLDDELYHRSNLFILGMILLECGSLRPAAECYDGENLDILDKEIKQRIAMMERFYGGSGNLLVRYVRMMVEYDYTERMEAKEMALMWNRESKEERVAGLRVDRDRGMGIGRSQGMGMNQGVNQMLVTSNIVQGVPGGGFQGGMPGNSSPGLVQSQLNPAPVAFNQSSPPRTTNFQPQ